MNVVDEFTREVLVMHTARSISADQTVAVLTGLVAERGAPTHIRCDNGPEMTAHALIDWCAGQSTTTSYIDPGAPWQNPFVESFHSRVRDELLNLELFSCLAEARVLVEDWREDYNQRRPPLRARPQGARRVRGRLDADHVTHREADRPRADGSLQLGSPSGLASQQASVRSSTYAPGNTSTQISQHVDRRTGSVQRSMASYGGASVSLELLASISARVDVIVIGAALGATQLGVYTIAFRLPEVLLASVAYTLAIVAFPALTRRRAEDEGGLAAGTLALLRYQTLYAASVGLGLAVLAGPLVTVLFGDRWEAARPVMVALAASFAVQASVFPLGDLLKAVGKQRILVGISVVQLPLLVTGLLLAAQSSVEVVAWTLAGFSMVFAAMLIWFVARELRVGVTDVVGAMAPGLAAGVGVAGGALGALAVAGDGFVVLAAGTLVGTATGALTLRLVAPAFASDVVRQGRSLLRSRRRERSAVPAG